MVRALIRVVVRQQREATLDAVGPDNLHVDDMTLGETVLLIAIRATAVQVPCRLCGRASARVYRRVLADVQGPSLAGPVRVVAGPGTPPPL